MLATSGFRADITTLQKLLRAKLTEYEQKFGEPIKVYAVAQMLANTLYGRRFFPYYTWNVLAGLDQDGATARLRRPVPQLRLFAPLTEPLYWPAPCRRGVHILVRSCRQLRARARQRDRLGRVAHSAAARQPV